ncbi:GtrA family protein [Streptomyces sp. NPDC001340]
MPNSTESVRDATTPSGPPTADVPADVAQVGVARQVPVFAIIGLISTAAYLGLYAALRPVLDAQLTNMIALLVTAVANTAANRRFTFRVYGADGAARQQLQGLVVFFCGLALSSGALTVVHRALPDTPHLVEIGALIVANAAATVLRFLLLRLWVFRKR